MGEAPRNRKGGITVSLQQLPSGSWRAQVWKDGRKVGVGTILGGSSSFPDRKAAKLAQAKAQLKLQDSLSSVTVEAWSLTWLSDPLYQPRKASTLLARRQGVKAFVDKHGTLPLSRVDDGVVADWIRGGNHLWTVAPLRKMFSDAASGKAGRLVASNPFKGLDLPSTRGRAEKQPPPEADIDRMLKFADRLTTPFFAAWLRVACFTGMRPGELDALKWDAVDFEKGRIRVREQWLGKAQSFDLPKNGRVRDAVMTQPAREALLSLPRSQGFVFVNSQGSHFRPASRDYYWNRVRGAMGWLEPGNRVDLYLATRHWTGWYLINVLEMAYEDAAIALGHEDGGYLMRRVYGHRDRGVALDRVASAWGAEVVPLRVVEGG
jgi:integrase